MAGYDIQQLSIATSSDVVQSPHMYFDILLFSLTSSDHRRAVRPKVRKKASTTHLKMLHNRKDITSEMAVPSESEEGSGLDPNTYSTYMGK